MCWWLASDCHTVKARGHSHAILWLWPLLQGLGNLPIQVWMSHGEEKRGLQPQRGAMAISIEFVSSLPP